MSLELFSCVSLHPAGATSLDLALKPQSLGQILFWKKCDIGGHFQTLFVPRKLILIRLKGRRPDELNVN